jgi:hypothetical protein
MSALSKTSKNNGHSPAKKNLKRKRSPFIPGESRIIPQPLSVSSNSNVSAPQISTNPPSPSGTTVSNPLTTLLLSYPLAQKIHQLILTSRQIEAICRGWFSGQKTPEMERRISDLEYQYDGLRVEVECELEAAWVNAGYLPAAIPDLNAIFSPSHKTLNSPSSPPPIPQTGLFADAKPINETEYYCQSPHYSVDKELKKQREAEEKNVRYVEYGYAREVEEGYYDDVYEMQDEYYLSEGDDGESYGGMVQPLESVAMAPLTRKQKQRMREFEWDEEVRGRKGWTLREALWGDCVSPKGTQMRWFW